MALVYRMCAVSRVGLVTMCALSRVGGLGIQVCAVG